jgi:hypothetical protein
MFTVDLDQGDDGGTTCCKKRKGIGAWQWGTKKLSLSLWCEFPIDLVEFPIFAYKSQTFLTLQVLPFCFKGKKMM